MARPPLRRARRQSCPRRQAAYRQPSCPNRRLLRGWTRPTARWWMQWIRRCTLALPNLNRTIRGSVPVARPAARRRKLTRVSCATPVLHWAASLRRRRVHVWRACRWFVGGFLLGVSTLASFYNRRAQTPNRTAPLAVCSFMLFALTFACTVGARRGPDRPGGALSPRRRVDQGCA